MLGFFKTWRKTPNSRLIRIRITFMKKSSIALAAAALAFAPALAQSANYFAPSDIYNGKGVVLFQKKGEIEDKPVFRIPAIKAGNGIIIAASDVRYSAGQDLATRGALYKTKLGTKMSFDGGKTWTDLAVHDAATGYEENHFMNMATDPAIVFDQQRDTIFMLGWRSNVHIANGALLQAGSKDPSNMIVGIPDQQQQSDLILYTSDNHGKTWKTRELTNEIMPQINKGQGNKKFNIVIQGPGGGMVYQGKIYMPIQAWATKKNTGGDFVSTSGFIVSADGGKTWEASEMLIPNVDAKINGTDKMDNTSESNIFYHKGKIRLAVKNEQRTTYKGEARLCFEYTLNEKTGEWYWKKVKEDFLPDNVSACEGSSHSLNEDVYLVAYSVTDNRDDPHLATNTGAKIKLAEGSGLGYTSITSDDNNIYVLFESVDNDAYSQSFKAIDWKHKDYAVLNTQMRNRAFELNDIQTKFSSGEDYMSASFTGEEISGDIVGGMNGYKGGIFISSTKNMDDDTPTVAEYDVRNVTLVGGIEHQLFEGAVGTFMVGYMNSAIDYANGSENDVNSFVAGYRINYKNDYFGLRSGFNFIISDNDLKRNKNEGLGKTASFSSDSFAFYNELYKDFSLSEYGDLELAAGMVNTFLYREGFREEGGEGFDPNGNVGANNAILSDISLQSHELFVKAGWNSKPIALDDIARLSFSSDLKYAIDVADMDKWKEDYISFTAQRTYNDVGELYSGRDGGLFSAEFGAKVQLLNKIDVSLKGVADSRGEFTGKLEGRVAL